MSPEAISWITVLIVGSVVAKAGGNVTICLMNAGGIRTGYKVCDTGRGTGCCRSDSKHAVQYPLARKRLPESSLPSST